MGVIFKCENKNCEYHPCFVECRKAADFNGFGDESLEVPETCPYVEISGEVPDFRFSSGGYQPSFRHLDSLEEWFGEHYDELPEDFVSSVEQCTFYGEKAQTDYRTVCQFANLMRYEEGDEDRWSLSERIEKICGKFKKREILISSLEAGYRIGLLMGARIMFESIGDVKENE